MTLYIRAIRRCALLASLVSATAFAAVPEQQAAQLGTSLTPLGAEKAGNKDGSIPAWTGGLQDNAGTVDAHGARSNPYASEKPLFIIDASNFQQYQANLSDGQVAMFKRYPQTFKMPIYPTHRSAALPDNEYRQAQENATRVTLANNGNGLNNYTRGIPFPIPQSGLEVLWNHLARYQGGSMKRTIVTVSPQSSGEFTPNVLDQEFATAWALSDYSADAIKNTLYFYKMRNVSPARYAGNVMLVRETIDQVAEPRLAWQYNAGQRRVRRAPQIGYDSPSSTSDGQHTSDNYTLFNGAPDRYDWKLLGKREVYVPYNSYLMDNSALKYTDIIKAGHLNPQYTRYELHRVWVVEATLKPGARHIYAKRRLYFDEDTWQAELADHYDSRGELWRVAEGHQEQLYDIKLPLMAVETCYDLQNGRYVVVGLHNEVSTPADFAFKASSADFTAAALRNAGVR